MRSTSSLLLALALLSCDPQADANYRGEPLISLQGQVVSSGPAPPLEAAMLWQRGEPPSTDDQELATRAPVSPAFPATFTAHLYQPPPAAARRTLAPGEVTYARANAGAVPPGIAVGVSVGGAASGPGPNAAGPYGIDANHWVIYLAADAPPGSLTAWWLGAALPAGFHLLRATAVNPQCMTPAELDACAADLAARGVPDDGSANPGTARFFCKAPYRLSPALPGEQLLLVLGAVGLGPAGGSCP
jgi:hypothetical protein